MAQTEFVTKRLDGKIALITGLATSQRLVAEGTYVFIPVVIKVNLTQE
jgi:hypothetical protein